MNQPPAADAPEALPASQACTKAAARASTMTVARTLKVTENAFPEMLPPLGVNLKGGGPK